MALRSGCARNRGVDSRREGEIELIDAGNNDVAAEARDGAVSERKQP